MVQLAPDSPEGQAAKRALDSAASRRIRRRAPPRSQVPDGPRSSCFVILIVFVARALLAALSTASSTGMRGRPPPRPRQRAAAGVQMVRDPVCGTFVVPERAVTLVDGRRQLSLLLDDLPRRVSAARRRPHEHRIARFAPTSSKSAAACTRAATPRRTTATSASASAHDRLLMTPEERLQGVHDAGHDVHHRSRRAEAPGRSRSVVRDADAPRGLPAAARRAGGRARASADRHRIRGRRHSARSRGARRSADDARQHSDCGVRDAVDQRAAGGGRASTSRRTTACCWPTTAR